VATAGGSGVDRGSTDYKKAAAACQSLLPAGSGAKSADPRRCGR
jgi:hypothetical protein